MLDPAIQEFLQKRKEDWLSKKRRASMNEEEIKLIEQEADDKFCVENWLPDAARRAGQMSISTHPCTFSHPSARKNKNGYVSPVIADGKWRVDGYLRTGNVQVDKDALGNAAALDVYKFLSLTLEDGDSLLEHLQRHSEQAKLLLSIPNEKSEELRDGLLAMANESANKAITSSKIKQVFFPVADEDYHLLSILSNSGLIYELRKRIDKLHFSEEQKNLRELKRKNQFSDKGFCEIYDITGIAYGGTKPQNISVLNNQYGGKAKLLLSIPPMLEKRDVKFPTKDFFKNSIRYYHIRDPLKKLHSIFKSGQDSVIPRRNLERGRDHRIEDILDKIIVTMNAVREVSAAQYFEKSSQLVPYQKIWLCHEFQQQRLEQDEWLEKLCDAITLWIIAAYKHVIKKPVALTTEEKIYIHDSSEIPSL